MVGFWLYQNDLKARRGGALSRVNDPQLLTMPVGNVLVRDAGCDIEHDDAAVSIDIVTVSKSAKLLLSCCIPYIENDLAQVLVTVSACVKHP